jgi:hypothetical protein
LVDPLKYRPSVIVTALVGPFIPVTSMVDGYGVPKSFRQTPVAVLFENVAVSANAGCAAVASQMKSASPPTAVHGRVQVTKPS